MPGLYVPLDVNYAEDDKIIDVGPMAELLYVRSLAFAKRARKDGHLRTSQLPTIAVRLPRPKVLAARLVEVRLWSPTPAGWFITAWLNHNATVSELHDKKSAAGVLGNHNRWHLPPLGTPSSECDICRQDGLVDRSGIAEAIAPHREVK